MCARSPEGQLSSGLHQEKHGHRAREGILPLCFDLVRPPWESCVQLWSPQHRTELELLERGQRRAAKMKFFYDEGGETLAQIAQRGERCPIHRNIPSQDGRGSEQPDPVEDVPAHGRVGGLDGLQRSPPTQTIL